MSYKFTNPIYGGQDPFVCKGKDGYYFVAEAEESKELYVYHSKRLTERGERHVVYEAEVSGESSADLWAPEIWNFNDKWYIYYAGASKPGQENWNTHRVFVLEADEPLGPYKPPIKLELGEQMAIDASVLQLEKDKFVCFYMGRNEEEKLNCLYMAYMDSPTHVCSKPVLLSRPELEWEGDINEGPFPIYRNGKVSLLYAANAAHLAEYCLGLLVCNDVENILEPTSWEKLQKPLLTQEGNVIGPGHGCIVGSPDNTEDWLLYHSKFNHDYTLPGGWNRVANLLRVTWIDDIIPCFEKIHQHGAEVLAPSGEMGLGLGTSMELKLDKTNRNEFAEYIYSREKTVTEDNRGIRIWGSVWPEFGDKLILREKIYSDCEIHIPIRILSEEGEAGIMFRVQLPAAGECRWKGYGVYVSQNGLLRLVKCDGTKIDILRETKVKQSQIFNITVTLLKDLLKVFVDDTEIFSVQDSTYLDGQIGIGTLGGDAEFTMLKIRRNGDA